MATAAERGLSSIRTNFNERKTTAAAAVLLQEAGGRMKYLRLIKLLYLADRESWRQFSKPITGDSYAAMKRGPVLSQTLNLIKRPPEKGPWAETIETDLAQHEVRLKREPDLGPLSDAEIEILKEAHRLHAQMDRWRLSDLTHAFSEWKDPGESSKPIWPEDILAALEKSEEEIEEARQDSAERVYFDKILGS